MKKYKEKKALHIPELKDSDVEKLAQDVPALNSGALKRITESCINKMGTAVSAEAVSDLTRVSGMENYSKPKLIRFVSTAAACAAIIISAAGVALINRNFSKSNTDLNHDDNIITNAMIAEVSSSGTPLTENNYNTAIGFTETSSGNNLSPTEQNTDNAQTSEAAAEKSQTSEAHIYETNTSEPLTQEPITNISPPTEDPLPGSSNRMTGIWMGSDNYKYKFITVDKNGRYSVYDKLGITLDAGYIASTELAAEPGTFDSFNTYSLDKAGISFHFTGNNSIKSLNNEEYNRISLDPNDLDNIINIQYGNNTNSDYSGVYEYSAGSHDPRVTITKSPDGSYKVELYIYRITCVESDEVSICDGYLAFSATDAAGDPIKGKITLTNEGCILSMTSTWAYLRGYTETYFTKTK